MLIINYAKPGPYEGPEQGTQWTMVFDGASIALGNGIGVVIISPEHFHTPFTARLCFDCTTWLNMKHASRVLRLTST